MAKPLEILSLGAGVQSSAVLLMSIRGDLPKLDHVIFSDTQWEPAGVYRHLDYLRGIAEENGIPLHIVTAGDLRDHTMRGRLRGRSEDGHTNMEIPIYLRTPSGGGRLMKRQCTNNYKIKPIRKKIREILGLRKGQRSGSEVLVRQWLGISAEESRRCRLSKDRWVENRYPLIFDASPPMRRAHCFRWLADNGYPRPPRSACIGCPFRSNEEWRALTPAELADAIEVDEKIRHCDQNKDEGRRELAFLHTSLLPLREADLRTPEERGQLNWLDECEGQCGV